MKKVLTSFLITTVLLVCAPCAFAEHIPPMNPGTPPSSASRPAHEDHASETADAAVAKAVQVILNLIVLGIGRN